MSDEKIKIHEIAKEFNVPAYVFLKAIQRLKPELHSHTLSVDEQTADELRSFYQDKLDRKKEAEEKVKKYKFKFLGVVYDPSKPEYTPITIDLTQEELDKLPHKKYEGGKTIYRCKSMLGQLILKCGFFTVNELEKIRNDLEE